MKIHRASTSTHSLPGTLKLAGCITAACFTLLAGAPAKAETIVFGQSDTILRMGGSDFERSKNLYPLTEYLRVSVVSASKDGSATSLHIGGWARVDLADRTRNDYTDADLQYGYISYQGAKNNLIINAGRQFITEGVAAQRLDGMYVRSDFAAGFGASAFVGTPAVTEPSFEGDDFLFGGRITHSMNKYYTLGISGLKSFAGSAQYREEQGLDLWLHPFKQMDVTGRSSYNSMTEGWMEHDYTLSYNPLENVRLTANVSNINYEDYFYKATTAALSLNNRLLEPNEKVLAIGGSLAYTPASNFTIVADYKNYDYDIARTAHYYGAKATALLPRDISTGLSLHRMDGQSSALQYNELRLYAAKKIQKFGLAADFIVLNFDNATNDVHNAYTVVGSASYDFTDSVRVVGNVDYSRNPFFDNEVRGLLKLTYAFDTRRTAERGAKE